MFGRKKELPSSDWIPVAEFARIVGVHKTTIGRKRQRKEIPESCFRRLGNTTYIDSVRAQIYTSGISDTGRFRVLHSRVASAIFWCKRRRYAVVVTLLLLVMVCENIASRPEVIQKLEMYHRQNTALELENNYLREENSGMHVALDRQFGMVESVEQLGGSLEDALIKQWDEALAVFTEENPNVELPTVGPLDTTKYFIGLMVDQLEKDMQVLVRVKTLAELTPNIWPIEGKIISYFGWREAKDGSRLARLLGISGKHWHPGVDISASQGTPVVATAFGVVTHNSWWSNYGNVVIIDHGQSNYSTRYAHLHEVTVEVGDEVTRGRVIGSVGSSGRSLAPHLHYEVHFMGYERDPMVFLP